MKEQICFGVFLLLFAYSKKVLKCFIAVGEYAKSIELNLKNVHKIFKRKRRLQRF